MGEEEKRKKRLALVDMKMMLTIAAAGCIIVIFYLIIGKVGYVWHLLAKLFSAMSPIIIGCIIAFLLNPVVNRFRIFSPRRTAFAFPRPRGRIS